MEIGSCGKLGAERITKGLMDFYAALNLATQITWRARCGLEATVGMWPDISDRTGGIGRRRKER